MTRKHLYSIVLFAFFGAMILSNATPASAQTATNTYNVVHNFWVWPANPLLAGQGWWRDYEHAWASQPGFPANANWSPGGQPLGYAPYGTDWQDRWGVVRNNALPVNMNLTGPFWVPPPYFNSRTVNAVSGASSATASASVSANAAGGVLSGTTRAWGTAVASGPGSQAYAFSSSSIFLRGLTIDWRTGRLRWTPMFRDSVSGSAFASVPRPRPRDPIAFRSIDDLDNVLWEDVPLEIWANITDGDGQWAWENGTLEAAVVDGEFFTSIESSTIPTSQWGHARLSVHNGVVDSSFGDGIFAGMLPLVGSPGTFSIPFPMNIEFDYALPQMGSQVEIVLSGGLTIPEPGTVMLLGLGVLALRRRTR